MLRSITRCIYRLGIGIRNRVARLHLQLLRKGSPNYRVDGLCVYNCDNPEASQGYFNHVAAAIELIAKVDARRLARMRHDFDSITIVPAVIRGMAGASAPSIRTCFVHPAAIRSGSVPQLALLMVHEATHARLHQSGVLSYPDRRKRVEGLCIQQTIVFAERLRAQGGYRNIDEWIVSQKKRLQLASPTS